MVQAPVLQREKGPGVELTLAHRVVKETEGATVPETVLLKRFDRPLRKRGYPGTSVSKLVSEPSRSEPNRSAGF